ncbi:MAG TPA: hypothetical protein VLF94_02535 [Chlamydiales bacterium]|nr:hypothetical protein [Chlamydiales bacterium]
MSYGIFSAMRSLVFIGTFLIAVLLLVPQAVKFWRLWKETGKPIHLSSAVGAGVIAFFFLAADFLGFMMAAAGGFRG